jgi:hypothetical protein
MQSTLNQENEADSARRSPTEAEVWQQLAPRLDDALNELGETDRAALVLRFFENKTAREMAEALRMKEDAVQKRVTRALEKLRTRLLKHGVTLTTTVLASAVATNSVQAAPVGMAVKISVVTAKGTAAMTTTVKGALKLMAWTKAKTTAAIAVSVLLAAGTVTVIKLNVLPATNEPSYQGERLSKLVQGLEFENRNPPPDLGYKLRGMGKAAVSNLIAMLRTHNPAMDARSPVLAKNSREINDLFMAEQTVHHRAATALGEIGPEASDAIRDLEILAGNPDIRTAGRARAALMKIRQEPVEPVVARLADIHSTNWLASVFIIKYLGTNAASAVPLLVEKLQAAKATTNRQATSSLLETLGGVASHPELSVPVLIGCLSDTNAPVRRCAIDGLCKFPEEKERIVPLFLTAMKDNDLNVWLGAALGLEEHFIADLKVRSAYVEALNASLQSPAGIIRVNAAMFLQRMNFISGTMAELNLWLTGGF